MGEERGEGRFSGGLDRKGQWGFGREGSVGVWTGGISGGLDGRGLQTEIIISWCFWIAPNVYSYIPVRS